MRNTPLVLVGVLILAFTGAFFLHQNARLGKPADSGEAAPASVPSAGATAPDFSLRDINGNVVDASHFLGRPTVINFFTTWCPPCREEIPGFVDVYNRYKDKGFELVGISLDTDTRGNLPAFVMENRIEYRILMGDLSTAQAYGGVVSLPTTFFIGKDGKIKNVHVGYLDQDSFDREVRKIL